MPWSPLSASRCATFAGDFSNDLRGRHWSGGKRHGASGVLAGGIKKVNGVAKGILGVVMVVLAACAQSPPQPEVKRYVSPSGGINCQIPWMSSGLSVIENRDSNYESVAFVIENGSIHTAERYLIAQYPWANPPKAVPAAKRLEHIQKIYLSQVWVPRFEVVETLAVEDRKLGDMPARFVAVNAEQNQRGQHYGLLLFAHGESQYVLQYSHPLIWGEAMIFSALREFYDKCQF